MLCVTEMGLRFRPQGLHFRPASLRFRPVGLRFKPQGLRFRPLGLRFRPVGLRFRPQGLRSSVFVFGSSFSTHPNYRSVQNADCCRLHFVLTGSIISFP